MDCLDDRVLAYFSASIGDAKFPRITPYGMEKAFPPYGSNISRAFINLFMYLRCLKEITFEVCNQPQMSSNGIANLKEKNQTVNQLFFLLLFAKWEEKK